MLCFAETRIHSYLGRLVNMLNRRGVCVDTSLNFNKQTNKQTNKRTNEQTNKHWALLFLDKQALI